jgi:fumarate reductase subunit D
MRALLLKLEPIIWLLFGQGILIGTMLLTGWILVVGLLIPLGLVDASALSYDRAHHLATAWIFGFLPIGQLVLAALLILPLWKGAHHVRALLVDLGGGERDAAVGSFLYAIAAIGSVLALMVVVRL